MPFWMNFVFQGARVGGLRDLRQLNLEIGRLGHLDNSPDSCAGKVEIQREKQLLKAVHLRYYRRIARSFRQLPQKAWALNSAPDPSHNPVSSINCTIPVGLVLLYLFPLMLVLGTLRTNGRTIWSWGRRLRLSPPGASFIKLFAAVIQEFSL